MANSFELPPLPSEVEDAYGVMYTADQMRAYALAAVEAEREACAKLAVVCPGYFATFKAADKFAELIHARGKS